MALFIRDKEPDLIHRAREYMKKLCPMSHNVVAEAASASAPPASMNKHEFARLIHMFNDPSVVVAKKQIQKGLVRPEPDAACSSGAFTLPSKAMHGRFV